MNTGGCFFIKSNSRFGYGLVGLVFILFLFAEIMNGRFWLSDFEVYYKAAARILQGQNLYRIKADDFYIFKYSPFSAVLFIPFSIFPFWIAKVMYWLFYSFIMLACIELSISMTSPGRLNEKPVRINTIVILTGLVMMVHFLRELHLGQVNVLLLFLYLLTCRSLLDKKAGAAGFLIALGVFIKPFGLIFLPYLLYKGRWKELGFFILYTLILALVPFLFYRSAAMMENQYIAWFHEVVVELGNKQAFSLPANQTIFSVLARYLFLGGVLNTPALFLSFQCLVLAVLALLVILFIRKGNGIANRDFPEMLLLMGLIPLLAFSGENSFCMLLPAVVLMLYVFRNLSLPLKILAVIAFLFLGGNMHDLWGDTISAWIDKVSLISFGAMIVCYILADIRFRKLR